MTNPKSLAVLVLLVVAAAGIVALLIPVPQEEDALQPLAEWRLPAELREVSGLTVLDDEHVLTMTDESARVYVIDITTGEVADFFVPVKPIKEDFEGIELLGDELFLITSKGQLFHFVGSDSGFEHHAVATGLRDTCEIEGLAVDEQELLIACKTNYDPADAGELLLFRFFPATRRLEPLFDVPVAGTFNLSAIATRKDKIYLLAARQKALIVLSRDGSIERLIELKGHPQAEGIAVMPDGRLVIADEGNKRGGKLTVYPAEWIGAAMPGND